MKRLLISGLTLVAILTSVGCNGLRSRSEAPPPFPQPKSSLFAKEKYAGPFGRAPVGGGLREVFLALPSELVADMPMRSRLQFLEMNKADGDVPVDGTTSPDANEPRMVDAGHGFLSYYSDNADSSIRASSIFYLKILPSKRYGYLVAIHMSKPSGKIGPQAANTFFLAPQNGRWIDVTNEVLPAVVARDWYFQPRQLEDVVEAGPYQLGSEGSWTPGPRRYDLVWREDRFEVALAADGAKYTY